MRAMFLMQLASAICQCCLSVAWQFDRAVGLIFISVLSAISRRARQIGEVVIVHAQQP